MKAFICVLLLVALRYATLARAQTTEQLWQVVTDRLQATTDNDKFFLLIGNESGIVYEFQRGSSIHGSTAVPIASASKWPMSVVIQRLFEEGILDVSTRAQDIISWWTKDPSDPRSRVTVYHLLTFQSGFNDDAGCLGDQSTISLEDCVRAIYDTNNSTEPGTAFYYGGNHMQVLGFMAQNKTGIDWKTLFSTYLTKPLNVAARYGGTTNPRMAGGIVSSAYDYEKMVRALYLKQYLLPETIDNMEVDRTNVTIAYSAATGFGLEWHYAFGHWVECNSSIFLPACGTDEYYVRSSPGAFGFYPFIDRTNNFYGVLSTTGSQGGVSAGIVYDVKQDIIAALRSASTPSSTAPSVSPNVSNTPANNPITTPTQTSRSSTLTFAIQLLFIVVLNLTM